jgi:hypothetical protein
MSKLLVWFTYSWWDYLFEKPLGERPLERIVCRIKGHPRGEVFFNPCGSEPDHRCKDCGDFIG